MPKNGECVRFNKYKRKIKSQLIIYADFESVLMSEDNEKENCEEYYTNKYKKHVACSHDYKLCVDDKFCKYSKFYLG